jgi:hypothetical protein
MEMHYKNISPYVDEVVFFQPDSFGGQMISERDELKVNTIDTVLPIYQFPQNTPCSALWDSICVTCEGYLTLCCSEALNYMVIEDVNKMSLKDAWNSERMNQMRKRHIENDLKGTQCEKCVNGCNITVEPLNNELFSKSLQSN